MKYKLKLYYSHSSLYHENSTFIGEKLFDITKNETEAHREIFLAALAKTKEITLMHDWNKVNIESIEYHPDKNYPRIEMRYHKEDSPCWTTYFTFRKSFVFEDDDQKAELLTYKDLAVRQFAKETFEEKNDRTNVS